LINERTHVKNLLKAGIPAAVGIGTLFLGSPSAWAATSSLTATTNGAYGTGSVTWASATRGEPVSLSVKDTKCDGHDVYIQFRVYYPGGSWLSTERRNTTNCNTTTSWTGLYINDARTIRGVRLHVCVDDWGGDTCTDSDYYDNPLNSIN